MIKVKDSVRIVSWEDQYHEEFRNIAIAWLEKFVSVEPEDLKILNDPKGYVLDQGGAIFFALIDGAVTGTVFMLKNGASSFELAKLGVKEEFKGFKIGEELMLTAISFAKEQNAQKIILFSNKKLVPALKLYEKLGFVELSLENNKYIESDIKMELLLG